MDNMVDSGKREDKLQYDASMGIIGWLAGALVVWAVVLIPYLTLS